MRHRALVFSIAAIVLAACAEDLRVGDRCEYSSECPSPLRCGFGRCRAECHVNVDCSLGAICQRGDDGIGSCSLPDDPGCASGADCAGGLVCVASRCADACASDVDCAGGNECWSVAELGASFCIDPRQRPDGGMPAGVDAGTDGGETSPRDAHVPPDAPPAPDGGQPCTGASCDEVADVVLAHRHACALTRGGDVWCWGIDESGESSASGAGADTCEALPCRTTPTHIALLGGSPAVQLALGSGFGCARTADGGVQCWGSNASGSLGRAEIGPAVDRVPGVGGATALAAGNTSVLAVTAEGIVGWGENRLDELQHAGTATLPVTITTSVGSLAVGGYFACALRGGEVRCWGANALGQLGRTLAAGAASSPDEGAVEGLTVMPSQLVAAAARTCAVDALGALTCWGYDVSGSAAPPASVPHGEAITALSSSPSSLVLCGLAGTARTAVCFGRAETAAFWPSGTTVTRTTPVPMHSALPTDLTKIATDGGTGCVVSATGELWCWGANDQGQLAQGTSGAPETVPVRVAIPAE